MCSGHYSDVYVFDGEIQMKKIRRAIVEFLFTFVPAFAVTAIVSLLWKLIAHGQGTVDWATSFWFGIVLGILLPWMNARCKKRQ